MLAGAVVPAEQVGDIGAAPRGQALSPGYGAMEIGRRFPDGVRGDSQCAADGIQIGIGGMELDAGCEGCAFRFGGGEDGGQIGPSRDGRGRRNGGLGGGHCRGSSRVADEQILWSARGKHG